MDNPPARVHAVSIESQSAGSPVSYAAVGTDDFALTCVQHSIIYRIAKRLPQAAAIEKDIAAALSSVKKSGGNPAAIAGDERYLQRQAPLAHTDVEPGVEAILSVAAKRGLFDEAAAERVRGELLHDEPPILLKNGTLDRITARNYAEYREIRIRALSPEGARRTMNALANVPEVKFAEWDKEGELHYRVANHALRGEAMAAVTEALTNEQLLTGAQGRINTAVSTHTRWR